MENCAGDVSCGFREVYLSLLSRLFVERPAEGMTLLRQYGIPDGAGYRAALEQLVEAAGTLPLPEIITTAERDAKWYASKGVRIISALDEDYPELLLEIPDAPPVLYLCGRPVWREGRVMAVVGTRLCSAYGREAADSIVRELHLKGYSPVIVSGLAFGIDIAAHRAALRCGAPTVAVLPNGMDRIYPYSHREDALKIMEKGALITEFPIGTAPIKRNFLKRNRIIAGISLLTVVVESRVKGGSMTTAEMASSYNRDLFAVPGRMGDSNSFGCNYLIFKNVASICAAPESIPELMGWRSDPQLYLCQRDLFSSPLEGRDRVLQMLSKRLYMSVDEIMRASGMGCAELTHILLDLELSGKVEAFLGRYKLV